MYRSEPRQSRKSFSFGAIFLIVLGLIFLLNNFGILPWEIWQNIWKFWPIFLILFGVEVLLGRTSSFRTIVLLVVLIFFLPIVLLLNPLTGNPLATETISFEKPLGNLTRAEIDMQLPSNNMKITSLSKDSSKAFESHLRYSKLLSAPQLVEDRRFGEAKYTFSQPEKYFPFSGNLGNTVNLKLSQLIPFSITTSSNVSVFDFDFSNLRVDQLEIESNAGSIEIKYSKSSSNKTFIKSGASTINLYIPKEIDASIKTETTAKSLKIDSTRFKKFDQEYRTVNFQNAAIKIQIEIFGSVTAIEIN